MRRFRFHLGTLVILVLLLGVGVAALRLQGAEVYPSKCRTLRPPCRQQLATDCSLCQQGEQHSQGHDSGCWIEPEHPCETTADQINRQQGGLREDWSLAHRLDRRNPGRAAFPTSLCQESGESLGTVQPRERTQTRRASLRTKPMKSSFEEVFPHITRWVKEFGRIEIG